MANMTPANMAAPDMDRLLKIKRRLMVALLMSEQKHCVGDGQVAPAGGGVGPSF
jgi:hypothetical protein